MGGFTVIVFNYIIIPSVLFSIASVILLIIGFIFKKDMLKRICGTIIITSPSFLYWIMLYLFLTDTLKVQFDLAGDLALMILVAVETLLLILIWKKKLTEYLQYSNQAETPIYRNPMNMKEKK
jgi:hypothetical protein